MAVIPTVSSKSTSLIFEINAWFKQLLWNDTESYTDNIYESLGPEDHFTFSTFVHGFNVPFGTSYTSIGPSSMLKELFMLNQDNITL